MGRDRELVLPPNTFAFVLDSTKGKVAVYVGPKKDSLSSTDQLVEWNDQKQRFIPVNDVERATQVFAMAGEGQYIVLSNPSSGPEEKQYPPKAALSEAVDLRVGRKVNIPGPATFPLWPGQTACAIDGHHLRHNQYLIVRVYDEEQARRNWKSAVMKPQMAKQSSVTAQGEAGAESSTSGEHTADSLLATIEEAPTLTMGQLMVVKGTEVSFYIPPTGVEVVQERGGNFVRDAVTLERLEYCVLLDENGEKSYRQGPKVVFPKPTEKFVEGGEGNRKFLGIELNEQSGIYVKVIDEYTEKNHTYKVGEELFITGKEQAIYFPRPEHSIIEYGNKRVHYAIAIPEGEGRYVLNRTGGSVDLKKGPAMFLPDPRTQVVVRRILDPHTVELLYPGNREAAAVNARYKEMSAGLTSGNYLTSAEASHGLVGSKASSSSGQEQFAGDSFMRTSSFSPPRTIVLDTKYEGAVAVNIWPGYAVMVVEKTGERRVEVGPKMILLEYGETLMPLELSTGKPKTDKNLFRTAYLRVTNNQVSDKVTVETKDLVKVDVMISYRVNFEGSSEEEQERWFSVENYVKVLTDHCRSRMRNFAKRHGIQEFYTNTIDIVRDAILGEVPEEGKRPGLPFSENGMRVYDVEVLDVSIEESSVSGLLVDAQERALSGAIELSAAEEAAERNKKLEELRRKELNEREATAKREAQLALDGIARKLAQDKARAAAEGAVAGVRRSEAIKALEDVKRAEEQRIELAQKEAEQEIARMQDETNEYVERTKAITPDMIAALQTFGDQRFVERVTEAVAPLALATGVTTADVLGQVFKGTPFEGVMQNLASRPLSKKD